MKVYAYSRYRILILILAVYPQDLEFTREASRLRCELTLIVRISEWCEL